jgi:alpha-ketoglutarate-dependent taurine dioxygenase
MVARARVAIRDETAWSATDYPGRDDWALALPAGAIAEIEAAGTSLPETDAFMDRVLTVLESGPGFVLLTGWPAERHDRKGNARALSLLGARLGSLVDQTMRHNRIEDITDRGLPFDRATRGYSGTDYLPFHTDGSDFAALMCLGVAAEGGRSILASAATVHNTILAERPDLLDVLYRGFHHHRRGEQAAGEAPVTPERLPVFRVEGSLIHCCYNRNPNEWLEREGIAVAEIETEALDYLDAVLERPNIQVRMALSPGDIQLINNYVVLHSRTAYVDGPGHKRHLLRLWIRSRAPRRAGPNLIDLYAPWESRSAPPA